MLIVLGISMLPLLCLLVNVIGNALKWGKKIYMLKIVLQFMYISHIFAIHLVTLK
jgi:hypothetical protein